MPGESSKPATPKKADENVLYIVLHGLVTLIDDKKNGFIAHLLDMGDDHKYLLGEWLSEDELPERKRGQAPLRAKLVNVDPNDVTGLNKLDLNLNAVVKIKSVPPDSSRKVRAVFRLPRPRRIYSFISGKLPKKAIAGTIGQLAKQPTHISGTQVFEYTFKDKTRVALKTPHGHTLWSPKAPARVKTKKGPAKALDVWVLHVYDEPGHEMANAQDHNRREFRMSARFFNSDLALVKESADPDDPTDLPPGLLFGDVRNLDERAMSVRPLVIKAREGEVGQDAGGGAGGPVCSGVHAQTI
jgi:hypothetical protein